MVDAAVRLFTGLDRDCDAPASAGEGSVVRSILGASEHRGTGAWN